MARVTRIFPVLAAASGLLAAVSLAHAQPTSSNQDRYERQVVRSDFEFLYEGLKEAHADLYVLRPENAYDEEFEEVLASIDRPMSRLEVVRLFTPFVAFGRIGHAKIDFPVSDYLAYYQRGGTLIPIDIVVDGGRVYISYNYSDNPALDPGAELLAINGVPAGDWLARVKRYISAERPYMANAQMETMFPRLVWLDAGEIKLFEMTVCGEAGKTTDVKVSSVSVDLVESHKGELEAGYHSRRAEMLPDKVAYLRPGPFYATGEETLAGFEAFIDESFKEFLEQGAADLIVDLRFNPGGDNSFSDPMIAWFADEPFRFASRFAVKASPQTRAVLEGLATAYPDGISAAMFAAMQKHKDGETFDFEIPLVRPRADRYEGRVWVLINRHSYSNATSVAAIVKDYGFGVVLGEETADLPSSYASSAQFKLPGTGIAVTYPKAYFVRPSGVESLSRGVVPDIVIERQASASGEDQVLNEALQQILSSRSSISASVE